MGSPDLRVLLESLRTLQVAPRPPRERLSAKGILPARLEPVAARLADLVEREARAVIPKVPELASDPALAEVWLTTSRLLARSYVRLSDLAVRKNLLPPNASIEAFGDAQLAALADAIVARYTETHAEIGFTKSRIEATPTKQQSGADIRALRRANPQVEEWLIRRVVGSSSGDPAGTLQAIQDDVTRFSPQFQSLASSDLTNIVALNRKNPRRALARAVKLQQSLGQEFPNFPPWVISKVAVQTPRNPRARMHAIQDVVAALTVDFPDEDPSVILYVSVTTSEPVGRLQQYAAHRRELAEAFPRVPRHVRDAIALHSPSDPVAALRSVAITAAHLTTNYPDIPPAVVLSTTATHRKDPVAVLDAIRTDIGVIATAFPKLPRWVGAKVAALQTNDPRAVVAALLEAHTRLIEQHPDISPSRLLHLAAINPLRPEEQIAPFLERRAELQRVFPDAQAGLIDEVADRYAQDPIEGMQAVLDAQDFLQRTRPELPVWVLNRLARSAPHAIGSRLAAFDLGCSVLRQLEPDAPATKIFQAAVTRPAETADRVSGFLNGDEFDDLDAAEADRLMGLMEQARAGAPTSAVGRNGS